MESREAKVSTFVFGPLFRACHYSYQMGDKRKYCTITVDNCLQQSHFYLLTSARVCPGIAVKETSCKISFLCGEQQKRAVTQLSNFTALLKQPGETSHPRCPPLFQTQTTSSSLLGTQQNSLNNNDRGFS